MAPYAHRCDGLGKRAGATDLNDVIYAASREISHPLPPVRDLAIVDHIVRSEGADTFQLLVRRRDGDNRRTRHLRDLQRGDGNAAGAQHQDGVAGFDLPVADQRPPGGDAGGGNGCGLGVAPTAWRVGESRRRPYRKVRGEAVDAVAWRAGEFAHRSAGQPILPLGEEAGNDVIAWPELRHAFAYGFDHAGAVGHQYPTVSGREAAIGDQQV